VLCEYARTLKRLITPSLLHKGNKTSCLVAQTGQEISPDDDFVTENAISAQIIGAIYVCLEGLIQCDNTT
jgi:hypothetical protein